MDYLETLWLINCYVKFKFKRKKNRINLIDSNWSISIIKIVIYYNKINTIKTLLNKKILLLFLFSINW